MRTRLKKRVSVDDSPIFFNDATVMKVNEHEHQRVLLNSQLTLSSHVQSAINKAKRGIGMLRCYLTICQGRL